VARAPCTSASLFRLGDNEEGDRSVRFRYVDVAWLALPMIDRSFAIFASILASSPVSVHTCQKYASTCRAKRRQLGKLKTSRRVAIHGRRRRTGRADNAVFIKQKATYQVHKHLPVHKCTNLIWAIHLKIDGQCVFYKEPSLHCNSLVLDFLRKPPPWLWCAVFKSWTNELQREGGSL
jgi:hypothetical protein